MASFHLPNMSPEEIVTRIAAINARGKFEYFGPEEFRMRPRAGVEIIDTHLSEGLKHMRRLRLMMHEVIICGTFECEEIDQLTALHRQLYDQMHFNVDQVFKYDLEMYLISYDAQVERLRLGNSGKIFFHYHMMAENMRRNKKEMVAAITDRRSKRMVQLEDAVELIGRQRAFLSLSRHWVMYNPMALILNQNIQCELKTTDYYIDQFRKVDRGEYVLRARVISLADTTYCPKSIRITRQTNGKYKAIQWEWRHSPRRGAFSSSPFVYITIKDESIAMETASDGTRKMLVPALFSRMTLR